MTKYFQMLRWRMDNSEQENANSITVKSKAINFLLQIRRFGRDVGVTYDQWYWEDLWGTIIGGFLFTATIYDDCLNTILHIVLTVNISGHYFILLSWYLLCSYCPVICTTTAALQTLQQREGPLISTRKFYN